MPARPSFSAPPGSPRQSRRRRAIVRASGRAACDPSTDANSDDNTVAGSGDSVLGGYENRAFDDNSAIGSGSYNAIDTGNDSGVLSFIGGGNENQIGSEQSFIGGGLTNKILQTRFGGVATGYENELLNGYADFIGGGESNLTDASQDAGIASGKENTITGVDHGVTETNGVPHIGPMAQDFYAAFHICADDRHIATIDEDGVALAAVKALYAENASSRGDVVELRGENASLRRSLAKLAETVAALPKRYVRSASANSVGRARA